jgi:hypothetical protein
MISYFSGKTAADDPKSACLDALSCRFFIRGFPPNKNAAKPSPLETLRVGGACALRLRGTRGARIATRIN